MRLVFCFSRSCKPYPTTFAFRSLPCCPGAKLRFSIGHFSEKHFAPLRNNFIPSRRQRRHTAPVYLAKSFLLLRWRSVYKAGDLFVPIQTAVSKSQGFRARPKAE